MSDRSPGRVGRGRPPPVTLETPRLRLEPTVPEHADELDARVVDSASELRPFLAWVEGSTVEDRRFFAQRCAEEWAQGTGWNFTMLHEGAVIGSIGLGRHLPMWDSADLGYWVATGFAGRGLTTEAGSAVVEFGFERLGLHRISLHAATTNPGSIRVAEKLGFTREGRLRDGARGAYGFHDCFIFGLLATDPRPRFHLEPGR